MIAEMILYRNAGLNGKIKVIKIYSKTKLHGIRIAFINKTFHLSSYKIERKNYPLLLPKKF
jgi:hypothetical protein